MAVGCLFHRGAAANRLDWSAQDRVYGDTRAYTKTESKRGVSRTIEWTDVYLQRGTATRMAAT